MSGKEKDAEAEPGLPDASEPSAGERVADYLKRNPDFLERHPEVLKVLTPPERHGGDGVIDIQRYMVERLRGEIENLRNCAVDLIGTSRSNLSNQTRTHAAVLAIMAAEDFTHFLRIMADDLPLLLDVDAVVIGFEPAAGALPELAPPDIRRLSEGILEHLMDGGRQVILASEMNDDGTIFGSASGLVRSAALARLRPGLRTPAGLLALGSRTPGTFNPGQGTDLIAFMARVVERHIHRWLESPA